MVEWRQGKCGATTSSGGRCQNKTLKGTSRCYLHQGDWTKRGQAEIKKRAARRRKK
ncbi:HGGxSTG domain-containing protein [Streptomyces sp. S6]